jgi:hypothetical protein
MVPRLGQDASFQIISNSLLTNHLSIRRYVNRDTASVVVSVPSEQRRWRSVTAQHRCGGTNALWSMALSECESDRNKTHINQTTSKCPLDFLSSAHPHRRPVIESSLVTFQPDTINQRQYNNLFALHKSHWRAQTPWHSCGVSARRWLGSWNCAHEPDKN